MGLPGTQCSLLGPLVSYEENGVLQMEQHALKNVNNCLNTIIYSYFETSGDQSSNPYLNVVPFLTPELIRNLWQLKTAVFLHWCLIRAVPFIDLKWYITRCNIDFINQQLNWGYFSLICDLPR